MDIVTIGEAMALVAPAGGAPLDRARELRLSAAGAESNVAVCMAQLGASARWVSRLGDDPLGRYVRDEIGSAGVDVGFVAIDPTARTGVLFKDPAPEGSTVHYYRDGSAATSLSYEDLLAAVPVPAGILHISGVTPALSDRCRELTTRALALEHRLAALTSFDVNYRPSLWPRDDAAATLRDLAGQADIVFVGLDEAAELWGVTTAEEVRALLPSPSAVVVKDGATGVTVLRKGRSVFVPALNIEVVEPVGAGDAFAGGYLMGLLRGFDDAQACRLGHLAAASVLTSTDDHTALPRLDDLVDVIRAADDDWPNRITLPGSSERERGGPEHANVI